ncbi:4a3a579f-3665-4edf-b868-af0d4b39d251 [Thermothielavioides terrestris]|uniref:4a3a579f-3665-4edf-b868-af0d4b39d251 n=1 Tax=Thermothielavioides terrestris TaxID=2587410 RepID=A0A3S4BG76_9PEZI|nr:4a3a579f-3665-4edf-b868-af0d4b39d251 [Thermothielavioides terrestris]
MSKPELPTVDEILARQSDIEQLPENPVDAPWASKGEYLAAQYGILRCEATEGLRYSVRSFADYGRKEPMMDDDFTNIYTKVRVTQYVMSSIGPLARVSFSTERSLYKIQWQQSKRLQPGKIVALSPKDDNFKTVCKIATVAQRPYRDGLDQDPPVVDLLWARPEDAVFDPSLEMVMIESLHGYFESARHALVGLQLAAQTDSPLDKYLTGAYTKDTYPRFLKEDPIMDLSSLASRATEADSEVVTELKTHDIVNGKIPVLKDLTFLDDSQLLALSRIISQELAIVQGPPGTGKTFTSVEAIKIMVANRRRHRGPPIVVAAQTNHALDQILVHCIKAGANVIRMGGRTQNELIKPRTLFELRQRAQIPADRKCNSIDHQRRENVRKIQELVDTLFGDSLLDPDALLRFGIITEAQHQSLCDESMEAHPALEAHGPFALWLGDSLIPAKIREDRHPTQLEVTEAEARKNLPEFEYEDDEEIENIADDEEDLVRFRGPVITLKYVWSGKDPANLSSWGRAVKRALRNDDLFAIEKNLRGAVYQYFQSRLLEAMTPEFAALLAENVVLCKKRKAFKFLGNTQLVEQQRIDIVGCTTTGLTKYRGCIAAMQPQSLLIEEAAETREANIVSALYPSVQQLILVGDHKQLAPKCDIQRLGDAPYNLNVSLFQRMVNLNMSFVMLKQQRRMKPELRAILNPFYPELVDHPSVESGENRPDVPGMGGRNSWIFHHNWPEDVNSDFSKLNEQEAEMIVHFFAYLVSNGTPAEKITVLTFYKGQRKVLLRKLKRHPSLMGALFNVCTVDSYQGEENDVVLLSMVRSPQKGRFYAVGFLEDERRAVVAISRARRGFYVFGNVDNVLQAHQLSHDLWHKICSGFVAQGRADWLRGLPLVCQSHGEETWIQKVDDWGDNCGGLSHPAVEDHVLTTIFK